jgi:FtsZ-binding cell division protein ZapB
LGDVEIDKLSTADLAEYISHLEEYQKDLSKEVTELDQKIQDLEKQTPVAKTSASTQSDKTLNTKSVVLDSEWLEGTAAAKPRTSQGSTPKPTNRVKKVPRVLRVPQEKQTQREAIEEIDRLAREIEGPKEKNKKK